MRERERERGEVRERREKGRLEGKQIDSQINLKHTLASSSLNKKAV